MSVLPCPGVRACPAPRAAAVSSDTMRTTGVRSAERKIAGRSAAPTPPGTLAATAGLAAGPARDWRGAGDRPGSRRDGRLIRRGARHADLARDRFGPDHIERARIGDVERRQGRSAGVTTSATDAWPAAASGVPAGSSSGVTRRSRPRVPRRRPPPARRPSPTPRSRASRAAPANDASANVTLAPSASGAARSTTKPQTWRIVERPPAPGGKASPASVSVSDSATPSTRRSNDGRRPSQQHLAAGVDLGVGDLAVTVGVEVESRLEGRDLRLVDDDVEEDPVGLDAQAGVVVDGEVAERVGEGRRPARGRPRPPPPRRRGPACGYAASDRVDVPSWRGYALGARTDDDGVARVRPIRTGRRRRLHSAT